MHLWLLALKVDSSSSEMVTMQNGPVNKHENKKQDKTEDEMARSKNHNTRKDRSNTRTTAFKWSIAENILEEVDLKYVHCRQIESIGTQFAIKNKTHDTNIGSHKGFLTQSFHHAKENTKIESALIF